MKVVKDLFLAIQILLFLDIYNAANTAALYGGKKIETNHNE